METLDDFRNLVENFKNQEHKMPVLFVGHGSPMNGIEDNEFSQTWSKMAKAIPIPTAVLVISAHWLTNGSRITAMDFPKTIHDFSGFPTELYQVQYPAPGSRSIALETASIIHSTNVLMDHDWGLDHGTWSIVRHMYPDAKIPVLQLSIDYSKGPSYHYELAKELIALRTKGILIIGSGNMVHNLGMVNWDKLNVTGYGYDWALEINQKFKNLIAQREHQKLIDYQKLGPAATLAIPTPEHYLPLIYTLGLNKENDQIEFFNDKALGGSLTMTSVKFN